MKKKKANAEVSELCHLVSVGEAALRDFEQLGIESVEQLARAKPQELYDRLSKIMGTQLDPCCLDVFQAAVAQARNPNLPKEQKNWWYWSRQRKISGSAQASSKPKT